MLLGCNAEARLEFVRLRWRAAIELGYDAIVALASIGFAPSVVNRLGQTLYRLASCFRDARNFILRPKIAGAAVLVRVSDQLLLIRTSYRPWYGVPCGVRKRGEDPRFTAVRELQEEVGMVVEASALRALGEFIIHHSWTEDHVHAFELRLDRYPQLCVDEREVVWAGFRAEAELSHLPVWPPLPTLLGSPRVGGSPWRQRAVGDGRQP